MNLESLMQGSGIAPPPRTTRALTHGSSKAYGREAWEQSPYGTYSAGRNEGGNRVDGSESCASDSGQGGAGVEWWLQECGGRVKGVLHVNTYDPRTLPRDVIAFEE